MIAKPRFVAIDTALLGHLAADLFGADSGRRARALLTTASLNHGAWIPLITWHHVEELLRYGDVSAVSDRVSLLRSFSRIAWLAPPERPYDLATVLDLLRCEIRGILKVTPHSHGALVNYVKGQLLQFGQPEDIRILSDWREARPLLEGRSERAREVVSIAHTEVDQLPKRPLAALERAAMRPIDDLRQLFTTNAQALAEQMSNRGDPRLRDATGSAARFYEQRMADIVAVQSLPGNAKARFLRTLDLTVDDVADDVSSDELVKVATRRHKVKVALSSTGVNLEEVWPSLRRATIPSEYVQDAIGSERQSAQRASGSDLYDSYIASMSPYIDAVLVDKRTLHYIKLAAARDTALHPFVSSAMRAPTYAEIPRVLSEVKGEQRGP